MVHPPPSSSSSSSPSLGLAVAVFCGSSTGKDEAFQAAARSLGSALAQSGHTLVYGGGSKGLMGAVSAAAWGAGGKSSGSSQGLSVSGGEGEKVDEGVDVDVDVGEANGDGDGKGDGKERTGEQLDVDGNAVHGQRHKVQTIAVDSMHERKVEMAKRVVGFVALPGGFGTFEEVLEAITWTQIGLHDKPVVLLNVNGFWDPLRALIKQSIQAGFIDPASERLAIFVDDPSSLDPSSSSSSSSNPEAEGRPFDEFDWGKAALEALDSWERGLVKQLYDWSDRMDRT